MGTVVQRRRLTRMRTIGRLPRLATGVLAITFVALLAPRAAVACSCIGGLSFEQHVELQPAAALIVGQVMQARGDGSFDFAVERWYGGRDRRATILLESAEQNGAFNTCGMTFTGGQRLLFLGAPQPDGRYAPGICSLSADPTTPEGADYERQAAALLGAVYVPQTEPPDAPPAPAPSGGADLALVVAGVAGSVALLFGGVILLGLRRRRT